MKMYSTRSYECVGCGGHCNTVMCGKSPYVPAKHILCEGNHTANYKECKVQTKLLKAKKHSKQHKLQW